MLRLEQRDAVRIARRRHLPHRAVWTPGLAQDDIILQVSRSQGQPNNAVFAFENGGDDHSFVFSTNIAKNTVGPFVTLTDTLFDFGTSPQMAYDYKTNQAVLAASTGAVFGPPPTIAIADLTAGTVTEFVGVGAGFINGLDVDSADGMGEQMRSLSSQKLDEVEALLEHTKAMKGWLEVAKECGCATPAECALFAAPDEQSAEAALALRLVRVDGLDCRRPPAG